MLAGRSVVVVVAEAVVELLDGRLQLLVDAVDQGVALRDIGDRADEQHAHRRERDDAGDQARAQGRHHALGGRRV